MPSREGEDVVGFSLEIVELCWRGTFFAKFFFTRICWRGNVSARKLYGGRAGVVPFHENAMFHANLASLCEEVMCWRHSTRKSLLAWLSFCEEVMCWSCSWCLTSFSRETSWAKTCWHGKILARNIFLLIHSSEKFKSWRVTILARNSCADVTLQWSHLHHIGKFCADVTLVRKSLGEVAPFSRESRVLKARDADATSQGSHLVRGTILTRKSCVDVALARTYLVRECWRAPFSQGVYLVCFCILGVFSCHLTLVSECNISRYVNFTWDFFFSWAKLT